MADEIASLILKVQTGDVEKARESLEKLTQTGAKAEGSASSLMGVFSRLAIAAGGVATVMATINKLVDTARTFQVLEASLQTVTGSAENAAIAMQAIKDFASTTPFSVEETTNAFIRLTSLGLDPSQKALTAYGNIAGGMGKNILDFAQAVGNATVGEFENLKTFGIKAIAEGDNVAFRFKGVTTTVANNASEIQKYLQNIGETDFAGGMERRAKTIDGALSNLADSWDFLLDSINKQGAGNLMADAIGVASDALAELNTSIASGQLTSYIGSFTSQYVGAAKEIGAGFQIMGTFVTEVFGTMSQDSRDSADDIRRSFSNVPSTITAWLQEAGVQVGAFYDEAAVRREEFEKEGVAPDVGAPIEKGSTDAYDLRVIAIREAKKTTIDAIDGERAAAAKATEEMIANAQKLRAEYEADEAARKASKADALAQFAPDDQGSSGPSAAEKKLAQKKIDEGKKQLEQVRQSLLSEEDAIRESHKARTKIIEDNTTEGSAIREKLLKESRDKEREELDQYYGEQRSIAEQGLLSEEDMLIQSFERKREIILENTQLSEDEKTTLITTAEELRNAKIKELEEKRQVDASQFFTNTLARQMNWSKRTEALESSHGANRARIVANTLTALTAAGAQHSRALFEINKIATVASIAMDTPAAIAGAYKFGAKLGGPALGTVFGGIAAVSMGAQMAAAYSVDFQGGGKGTTPSSAGTMPVINDVPVAPDATTNKFSGGNGQSGVTIIVNGDFVGKNAEELFGQFKTLIDDQDFVLFESTSRQAIELRS